MKKRRPHAEEPHRERRRDRDRDAKQDSALVGGVERPCALHPARGELRPPRTCKGLHDAVVGGGAAFRQRRLRGAAGGGDVDADRRVGLGPDHLREFARFAGALRPPAPGSIRKSSPSAGCDAGSLGLAAVLGCAPRCGAASGASASTPGDAEPAGWAAPGGFWLPAAPPRRPHRRQARSRCRRGAQSEVSRTPCRSARRECVRRSAFACSAFSSAK